jgi:hypothetical protein
MTKLPTYQEVALGMMKATDPFSGKYPNITNSLSTKTPEFKQLLGESLNQLQEQQIQEAKQKQLHELFRMTAHESGQSFHEVRSLHSRPMSISNQ